MKGVSHVFNFDTPWHPDDYVHRIGRTGRAGATGRAFTFVAPDDAEAIANVEKLTGMKIPVYDLGGASGSEAEPEERSEREERKPRDRRARGDRPAREERAPREERPRREDRPVREARAARPGREDYRPRREPDEPPSKPGEWNGPVPGFLSVSAL